MWLPQAGLVLENPPRVLRTQIGEASGLTSSDSDVEDSFIDKAEFNGSLAGAVTPENRSDVLPATWSPIPSAGQRV